MNAEHIKITREQDEELELRITGVTHNTFQAVFDKLMGVKSDLLKPDNIECSLNSISNNQIRKDIFDIKNNTKETTYYSKTLINSSQIIQNKTVFKLVRSKETTIDSFVLVAPLYRFKRRASFLLHANESIYRIDLTMTRSTKNMKSLPIIKKEIFGTSDITFANYLNVNVTDDMVFEIEIEYISLTSDQNYIITYFSDLLVGEKHITTNNNTNKYISILGAILKRNRPTLKKLLNQAKSLTRAIYYSIYPPVNWYITDKKDGFRCVLFAETLTLVTETDIVQLETEHDNKNISIIDGELVNDEFYAFDIIRYGEQPLINEIFETRYEKLLDAIKSINHSQVKMSNMIRLTDNYKNEIKSYANNNATYETDGLIFTSYQYNYAQTLNYKWKPTEQNTIDFLCMKCPSSLLGNNPYMKRLNKTLYILFVGIHIGEYINMNLTKIPKYNEIFATVNIGQSYIPIQFSPPTIPNAYLFYHDESEDLHKKIVELQYLPQTNDWKLVKIRTDRTIKDDYYGNNYKVAIEIFMNYLVPLEFDQLINPNMLDQYFNKPKADDDIANTNKYNRYVVSQIFMQHLQNMHFIIDLAAGRGADMSRYARINIKKLLVIERDKDAITELINRRIKNKYAKFKLLAYPIDLKTPYNKIMEGLSNTFSVVNYAANGIVCNFAMHYFCDTKKNVENIAQLISHLLELNGIFIFTVMDGKSIHEILTDMPVWENSKYRLEKLYDGDKLKSFGQNIKVKLPFSDELCEEPLCNIEAVLDVFKSHNLTLVQRGSFLDFIDDGQVKAISSVLTEDDREFIELYHYVVVRRSQKVTGSGRTVKQSIAKATNPRKNMKSKYQF